MFSLSILYILETGKIFTFGDGRHGKLGQGEECFSNLFKPTIVQRFKEFHVNSVACGGCHMLVSAVRTENENADDEEEDSLASSMISRNSIQEANMTLRPGNMTFPTVSKRDKRRLKGESDEVYFLMFYYCCFVTVFKLIYVDIVSYNNLSLCVYCM